MRKKIFCLILSCIMALGIMPASAFAEDTKVLEKAYFTITEPVIGEKPDTTINVTFNPSDYTYSEISVNWVRSSTSNIPSLGDWELMGADDTFEAGYYYQVICNIKNNIEGEWEFSGSTEIYINNKKIDFIQSMPERITAAKVFDNLFNAVTKIDITVDPPVIGNTPDYSTNNITFTPSGFTPESIRVSWWKNSTTNDPDVGEWTLMDTDEKFEAGFYYQVAYSIYTNPDENMEASDSTKIYINGNKADYFLYNRNNIATARVFDKLGEVTNIDVTVNPPVVGETPDLSPQFTSTPADSVSTRFAPNWFKCDKESYENGESNEIDWRIMSDADEFKEGYYYRVEVPFNTVNNKYFFTENTKTTVNGKSNGSPTFKDNDLTVACASATFGPLAPIPVTDILVTVDQPYIGNTPDFTPAEDNASIDGGYGYEEDIIELKDGSLKWYEYDEENDTWVEMAENDEFKKGYYYRIDAEFETNTGYCFTTDTKAKVNGYRHNSDRPVYGEDSTCAYVSRTFGPLKYGITEVTGIAATIDTPVIGKTPDYEPRVTSNPADSVEVYDVKWYKTDNENPSNGDILGNPGVELGKDEKFEEGYCYVIQVKFQTKYGYCLDSLIVPTINGMNNTNGAFGEFEISTYVLFEPEKPVNVDEPITSIAAKVDAPAIGNTPDFSPEITSAPEGSAELFKAIWYKIPEDKYTGTADDSWELMAQDETFKEGYYYSVLVGAVKNDGFCFTNDTTATLNGKPHVETLGPVYSDEYEDSVARIYGVFEPLHSQSSSSSGGGNSSIYYKLTFDTNGGSSISGITKSSGTKIDLEKYEPEKEGFAFTGWYSDRELTDKITSIKLLKNTTVYAGWKAIEEDPVTDEFPFADVDTDDWFFEDVAYVYENGLMSGTSADTFSPETATTRGMIVTILYRLEGEPEISGSCAFDDVKSGWYYENAIAWAAANGIVSGYDNGLFGPDDAITREQLATILYRYAQYKGLDVSVGGDTNILSYNDALDISEYAVPAMQWLCGEGIMSGSDGNLMPMGNATRAQVAAFLHRFCENILE